MEVFIFVVYRVIYIIILIVIQYNGICYLYFIDSYIIIYVYILFILYQLLVLLGLQRKQYKNGMNRTEGRKENKVVEIHK